MRLLGFEIKRESDTENPEDQPLSFADPLNDDGALTVGTALGGSYSVMLDIEGSAKTEAELVTKYRGMFLHAEIQQGVEEITNEAISVDSNEKVVEIILDDTELPDKAKDMIVEEFEEILRLLDFSNSAYETFQRWYVDGRLNYHVIIDKKNLKEGIKELRYLDPRKIRLIREMDDRTKDPHTGVNMKRVRKEYYAYAENGFGAIQNQRLGSSSASSQQVAGFRIAKDAIVRVTSGLMNENNSLVLSYLHRSIKPLNQLKMLEDATVIYTLTRAPERRVFYIDVGNLPKAKAEQYLHDMMARHKNKLQYDSTTGDISDSRKFMCYDLGTKIPLLDGRTLELRELIAEHEEGKKNWVYSCDPETGKFYPGPVSWAGVTKHNAEVVRVTFDNGKSVTCTPDHKFPVWGKGFVEAQHLTPEDSIIPGYRRQKAIAFDGNEYEQIYKNETQKWEYTHREVAKWKAEVNLREEFTFSAGYAEAPKTVVHHRDYNRYNNNPENLVMMSHRDHLLFHQAGSVDYTRELVELVDSCAKLGMSMNATIAHVNAQPLHMVMWRALNIDNCLKGRDVENLTFTYKDLKRISEECNFSGWREFCRSYETFEREANGRKKRGFTSVKGSPEHYKKISEAHKGQAYSAKTWKVIHPSGDVEVVENLSAYCRENNLHRSNIKRDYGSRGYHAEQLVNHRIVSVEPLVDKITVGSISVDNNETYHSHHTYLLDAGVYTKNTMTEDFWFPRREGNRATEIEPLAGGTSLQDNENLTYFQNKLFKSLGVPLARLQPETMFSLGRSNETTREELKFSKFTRRLRSRFSQLFDKCLEKQLVLKGIMSPEEWDEVKDKIRYDFMKDNHFEELKHAEVMRERMSTVRDMQDSIGTYFSHQWVMKNILMMSEDEIKEMRKQIEKEKKDDFYAVALGPDGQPVDGGDGGLTPQAPDGAAPPSPAGVPPSSPGPDDQADESLKVMNKKKT